MKILFPNASKITKVKSIIYAKTSEHIYSQKKARNSDTVKMIINDCNCLCLVKDIFLVEYLENGIVEYVVKNPISTSKLSKAWKTTQLKFWGL